MSSKAKEKCCCGDMWNEHFTKLTYADGKCKYQKIEWKDMEKITYECICTSFLSIAQVSAP